MKRKMAVLIAGVMFMSSLAACTDSSEDSSEGQATESTQSDESASSDTVKADKTLDLFVNFTWFPSDSWTGIIPETITEKTGIAFDVTRATDENQLGVMIASGELPDVIFTDSSLDRLSDSSVCYSYNELIDKYNIDWKPDDERIAIAQNKNLNKDDENYYTLLSAYSTNAEWESAKDVVAPQLGCLYYRKDIWESLGSPKMDTMEDIENVLEMVKEKYPDMIPLSAGSPTWRFTPFYEWFGGRPEFLYDEADGVIKYRDTTENFYNTAKFVNSLYQKGLFPEENLAITNQDDAKQQFTVGKSFMYEWNGRTLHVDELKSEIQRNITDADVAIVPIPDDSKEIQTSDAGWAGVFISKNCKDPEAAIKMISYLNSDEGRRLVVWGREGTDYTLDKDTDMPHFSDEWKEAQKDADLFTKKYNANYIMTNTQIDELKSYFADADQTVVESLLKNTDKVVRHPELGMIIPQTSTDEGIIYSKIEEARKAETMKLFTADSDEDFEKAYGNYMELLKKMGVEQLNEYAKTAAEDVLAKLS